jgi:hypothetical protein
VHHHNLIEKIENLLVSKNVNITYNAYGGYRIGVFKSMIDGILLGKKPDAILIFWDSDCSDIDVSINHVILLLSYNV